MSGSSQPRRKIGRLAKPIGKTQGPSTALGMTVEIRDGLEIEAAFMGPRACMGSSLRSSRFFLRFG
jgi:hypothetical protein